MQQVNDLFKKAIQALVDKHETHQAARISSNQIVLRDYRNNPSSSFQLAFERMCGEYEQLGMIEVKRIKGSAGIQSISLKDYHKAIELLNHTPLKAQIKKALSAFVLNFTKPLSEDVERCAEYAQFQWTNKQKFLGCSVGESKKLATIVKAAIGVIAQKHKYDSIDYRHFSATHLDHSKHLSEIKGKVVEAVKLLEAENIKGLSSEDFLAAYGVVQLNHPVYLSGEIYLLSDNRRLDAGFDGGVGVWPVHVNQIEMIAPISTITTIENQATYEKYLFNRKADEVVLFTSGIPSPGFKRLYRMIVAACQTAIVKHWGDIDIGGFTILNMLEFSIKKSVKAFNMEPSKYSKNYGSFSKSEVEHLKKIKVSKINEEVLDLAINCEKKFEQESFKWID